jgi:hypothetical protein
MTRQRRWALGSALAQLACTPPADTVGAWTGSDTTSITSADSSSDGVAAQTTGSGQDSGSTSGPPPSSSSESVTATESSTGTSAVPPWLATVVDGAPPRLQAIDVESGALVEVCDLDAVAEPDALAFLPDGRIVGTRADVLAIWTLEPCTCDIELVPPLEPPLALHAMAERPDDVATIVGADAVRMGLFEVDVDAATVGLFGELADAGAVAALAAAPGLADVHALVTGPRLQRVSPGGVIVSDVPLDISDDASGLTIAHDGEALLACDGAGALWHIDVDDGASELLPVALAPGCRSLATPHGPIGCIDALF